MHIITLANYPNYAAAKGNVTTGPQTGSPGRPRELALSKTISAVRLSWTNGNSGRGPILGYYVESRRKGEQAERGSCLKLTGVASIINQSVTLIRESDASIINPS